MQENKYDNKYDEVISAPTVSEKIISDTCIISGGFSDEREAERLAFLMGNGALLFEMITEK